MPFQLLHFDIISWCQRLISYHKGRSQQMCSAPKYTVYTFEFRKHIKQMENTSSLNQKWKHTFWCFPHPSHHRHTACRCNWRAFQISECNTMKMKHADDGMICQLYFTFSFIYLKPLELKTEKKKADVAIRFWIIDNFLYIFGFCFASTNREYSPK